MVLSEGNIGSSIAVLPYFFNFTSNAEFVHQLHEKYGKTSL